MLYSLAKEECGVIESVLDSFIWGSLGLLQLITKFRV